MISFIRKMERHFNTMGDASDSQTLVLSSGTSTQFFPAPVVRPVEF